MQPFGRDRYGPKIGGGRAVSLWGTGSSVPIEHNVARVEAYLRGVSAKFHLEPSSRLATVHERHRQNRTDSYRQTSQRSDSIGRTVLQTVAQKSNNIARISVYVNVGLHVHCDLCQ